MTKLTQKQINRQDQSLNNYLQEIGNVPLLSPQEEIHLAHSIKKNDRMRWKPSGLIMIRFMEIDTYCIKIKF